MSPVFCYAAASPPSPTMRYGSHFFVKTEKYETVFVRVTEVSETAW